MDYSQILDKEHCTLIALMNVLLMEPSLGTRWNSLCVDNGSLSVENGTVKQGVLHISSMF